MDWNQLQGNWAQVSRRAQQRWGKLTDADLAPARDQRDRLLERIQARYGVVRDEAERQLQNWEHKATALWVRAGAPAARAPIA
ncbi:CsbD family protein [Hydrogenophaga sp. OTU3427]|uniref:CsbD family protein n=1 Tax=Hydrogenophaga sp. OTU3427 TaxID=3043856 RepID=UPI00313E04C8